MGDTRHCEQCGSVFVPRREHARFCSVRCRVAWNREKTSDPAAEGSALLWSVTAMTETAQRLGRVSGRDRPEACTVIGEAVWWITIVDATLVRHHAGAYDGVLARQGVQERRRVEGTLAGLRFVRNRIGQQADLGEFITPGPAGPGEGTGRDPGWTWRPVPEPGLGSLRPRARKWEKTRYGAYQSWLAGHAVHETLGQAMGFLTLTAADVAAITGTSSRAGLWQEPSARSAPS